MTRSGTEAMSSLIDYCVVFMHPYSHPTVMIPAPPEQIEGRWKRAKRYAKGAFLIIFRNYF